MGETVGNTLKLISGFVLFVVGVLITFEASIYNLMEILVVLGFIIAIAGIIMVISYFVDANADRTSTLFREFLESDNFNASSFRNKNHDDKSKSPLRIRNDFDDYDDDFIEFDENYEGISPKEFFDSEYIDTSKSVLKVNNNKITTDFGDNLEFTPNYDKPLKITRKPKKRSARHPVHKANPDKSEHIKQALVQDDDYLRKETHDNVDISKPRDIKIDVNDPESLPVPKLLRSFVVCKGGLLTSKDAFDKLSRNINKEVMLEIPSLNDLSESFLANVPSIYSRVIINDFDVNDVSYMILVSSLLKQGVQIKTVPNVHSINLITDDSYAMIISRGSINSDAEYGAIYDDRDSISAIRASFEKTWDIASDLDENLFDYT